MEPGALQVRVLVDGVQGHAELSVPVPSFAQRTLPMQKPLRILLLALMLFLAVGAVSIVGAGVREAKLPPGAKPAGANIRRARNVMVIAAVLVVTALYLGRAWWGLEDSDYRRNIAYFKPPIAITSLTNGSRLTIRAKGQDPDWSDYVRLRDALPDHGHLMHLFLIGGPGLDRIWHLHPDRLDAAAFAQDLPSMPAGHYQVFADIVDSRGYPWTLVGAVDLPQITGKALAGDDSSWTGAPLSSPPDGSTVSLLSDGGRIVWHRPPGPLKANVATSFKFTVEDKDGKPATDLEPYMGMAGHAEFVRSDLSVFAHIHPAGSVSMAALELAQAGLPAKLGSAQDAMSTAMPMQSGPLSPEVSFPYGFPQAGDYRIFMQIKRAGRVETGVFDARVD